MQELAPVTKDSLIHGYLKLYAVGSVEAEVIIGEIKKIVEDKRLAWKE